MKKIVYLLSVLLLTISACKPEKKQETDTVPEQTILEKVAYAHGFENWNAIQEIRFTFNVDRDTVHFERHWIWNTKTQDVQEISLGDTIRYNRKSVDSVASKADAAFINDKYWLLAPINILWDQNSLSYSVEENVPAPISGDSLTKLTVVYGNEGGYTPGDAYDFFLADDHTIKEWIFRRGNAAEPSTVTTWEDYVTINGISIAKMHKNKEGNFSLYFSGLEVKK